jgi:tetratricopeptide (TPR) repeat protein
LARALTRLGQIERDLGDGETARAHYQEAVSIYRTEGDVLGLAHALRHLGDIHHDHARPDLAAPCYEEALDLYRRSVMTRRSDLANAVRSMALHQESIGDFEQATQGWEEARALYASLDGPLRRLMGRAPNAGVVESEEHLARLAEQRQGGQPPTPNV